MPFENTTRGNPHRLTVDQHFHTAHAIAKFYDVDDKVEVKFIKTGLVEKRQKRAKVFCTKRTWDQRTEDIIFPPIERKFHEEIDIIKSYIDRDHQAISWYFLLWQIRYERHLFPLDESIMNEATIYSGSKKEQEYLESLGILFVKKGREGKGVLSSRARNGWLIQVDLYARWNKVKDWKWGLLEARQGEFLVADSYQSYAFMPIAPNLAFAVGTNDCYISKQEVANINSISKSEAREFYFARKISACPTGYTIGFRRSK